MYGRIGVDLCMNKLLVKLYVPLIQKEYDVFIPINKNIKNIIYLCGKVINELSEGEYPIDYSSKLANRDTGYIYNINSNPKDEKILNGSSLVLF